MRRWISFLFGGLKRRAGNALWAGMTEVVLAATLLLIGIVVLIVSITLAVQYSSPTELYISIWTFALQLLVGIALASIGIYRVLVTFWKVGASAERRGAIVSRAGEIEILNELRHRREDLPTVPLDRIAPRQGRRFRFSLSSSRRNAMGFALSATLAVVFVMLATIVSLSAIQTYRRGDPDWFAIGLTLPMGLAASWTVYHFYRQLLKLTGIGPTELEVSDYPLKPGGEYTIALTQPGRSHLRLLDVLLVCLEEATFDQGTDIRTEKTIVYEQRLLRKRDITLTPESPFEVELKLSLPAGAMHSFKSENNRVQWKIVVHSQAIGWPKLERSFPVSVHPPEPTDAAVRDVTVGVKS